MTRIASLALVLLVPTSSLAATPGYFSVSDCSKIAKTASSAHLCACVEMAAKVNDDTSGKDWVHFTGAFVASSGYLVSGAAAGDGNSCIDLDVMVNGSASVTARNSFTEAMVDALDDLADDWTEPTYGREYYNTFSETDYYSDTKNRLDKVLEGSSFITFGDPVGLTGGLPKVVRISIQDIAPGVAVVLDSNGSPLATVESISPLEGAYTEYNAETGNIDLVTFHSDGSSAILDDVGQGSVYVLPF